MIRGVLNGRPYMDKELRVDDKCEKTYGTACALAEEFLDAPFEKEPEPEPGEPIDYLMKSSENEIYLQIFIPTSKAESYRIALNKKIIDFVYEEIKLSKRWLPKK